MKVAYVKWMVGIVLCTSSVSLVASSAFSAGNAISFGKQISDLPGLIRELNESEFPELRGKPVRVQDGVLTLQCQELTDTEVFVRVAVSGCKRCDLFSVFALRKSGGALADILPFAITNTDDEGNYVRSVLINRSFIPAGGKVDFMGSVRQFDENGRSIALNGVAECSLSN